VTGRDSKAPLVEVMPQLAARVKCVASAHVLVLGERHENAFSGTWSRKVTLDGRELRVGVERGKRVRIAFKPRNNGGWGYHYYGFVRENGREIWCDRVQGSAGVRGILVDAGLLPLPANDHRQHARRCMLDVFPHGSIRWCEVPDAA